MKIFFWHAFHFCFNYFLIEGECNWRAIYFFKFLISHTISRLHHLSALIVLNTERRIVCHRLFWLMYHAEKLMLVWKLREACCMSKKWASQPKLQSSYWQETFTNKILKVQEKVQFFIKPEWFCGVKGLALSILHKVEKNWSQRLSAAFHIIDIQELPRCCWRWFFSLKG